MWTGQVTYESGMTGSYHTYELWHVQLDRITHEPLSQMPESRPMWMSHVPCEWVTSHVNESWHTWMSRGTREWVTSHMNASWHMWMSGVTHELVMSHRNESSHRCCVGWCGSYRVGFAHDWVMSHMTCVTRLVYMWHDLWDDSFICDITQSCATRLVYTWQDWVMSHINESSHRCCVGWCGS